MMADRPSIIDISEFRVRIPPDLYPYRGSHVFNVSLARDTPDDAEGCSTIPECSDSHVQMSVGTAAGRIFAGQFGERNSLNIPGPFYGAGTDTCETGPSEAPNNVMLDEEGYEFVYRQPTSIEEICQIIGAAVADPFAGYGADGNDHWTLPLVRDWWRERDEILARSHELAHRNDNIAGWVHWMRNGAEPYLRRYAFFLEEGRLPESSDRLPDL